MTTFRKLASVGFALAVIAFVALQVWATRAVVDASRNSSFELQRRLATLDEDKLSQAKTQEEIIALRVENDRKAVFITTFVANMNAAIAVLVTLIGAGIGLYQYISIRRKERTDRASSELTELWKGITSTDPQVRAGSVAGLQHFLHPERAEFHPRVASALALLGRLPTEDEAVLTTYSRVVESAMQKISPEIRRSVSWQGVRFIRANLRNIDLAGCDFRDAILQDCDFTGSNLSGARFDAARLTWAHFAEANLSGASLRYADLAGADLNHARLQGANLRHAKVLGVDLYKANLTDVSFRLDSLDWSLTRNWRKATLDAKLSTQLLSRYGPEVKGIKILMLLWEYPPFVSGGGWTAAFHLLKSLRLMGADVTIMIPWAETAISRTALGYEYDLLCAGIESASDSKSAYGPYSSYSGSGGRSIERGSLNYGAGRSLGSMVGEFERRGVELVGEQKRTFDLVHAHDWLTFGAGRRLAAELGLPWVAHFHSTEFDRRSQNPSKSIERAEREACKSANTIVAVGAPLKKVLVSRYGVDEKAVHVVPNCFSTVSEGVDRIGDFDAQRIVFVGRMTDQKGPDHFVRIAHELRKLRRRTNFAMIGTGEMERRVAALVDKLGTRPFLSTDPIRQTSTYYVFSRAEPVDIDPDTGEWFGHGRLSESDTRALAQMVSASAFTVRPIQRAQPYTHLITLSTEQAKDDLADSETGKQGASYLVQTSVLPSYAALPDPFILMEDALPWEERRLAYYGASLVIVPSRSEPFGLVVLEAMQFGVPVFYPENAGVAEFVSSGVRIDPEDYAGVAGKADELLGNPELWDRTVEEQILEISAYPSISHAARLQKVWDGAHSRTATTA
ncbi:MAG TPA: pentapeptide repeat-containing protein [Candidatus Acidoferrum sp.]|nr:pentapeptide repeat-containing protein [Candidatus Acidoferrum sp.]